jgi:hypothetical protein
MSAGVSDNNQRPVFALKRAFANEAVYVWSSAKAAVDTT